MPERDKPLARSSCKKKESTKSPWTSSARKDPRERGTHSTLDPTEAYLAKDPPTRVLWVGYWRAEGEKAREA
jgi:hypothetical protein